MPHLRHDLLSAALALALPWSLSAQPESEAPASAETSSVPASLAAAAPEVRQYQQYVSTLADAFFEGRAPGLKGNRLAADYVEFHFRRMGLQPAFMQKPAGEGEDQAISPEATFRQPFTVGSTLSVSSRRAAFTPADGPEVVLEPLTDFTVHEYSASGEVAGPVAFVGYSIPEGQDGYATYPPLPESPGMLKGKIALILRFEPMTAEGKSRWIEEGWSLNADLTSKLESAAARGASGIILVTPGKADDRRAGEIKDADGGRSMGFGLEVPVVMMTPEAADRLVRAGDAEHRSLSDLQKLADEAGGVIDLPGVTVSLGAGIDQHPILTDNVGAVLSGKGDLADEYVIVGAHYDHVGYGFGSGGPLHPGADDNASGTSGVLLMAEQLKRDYAEIPEGASARSILFLCFSAEEMGLIGSRYYVEHPSVPVDKMHLMLNMDMIGRLREDHLEVGGVGTGEGLEAFLQPYLDASGMTITPSSVGDDRSDHASFRSASVPALFFFTGLHEDYHQPGDFAWKINVEGAVRVTQLVREIAVGSAQRREGFAYTGPRTSRVMIGIAPGEDDPAGGLTIGMIVPGSAAEEAGLKAGDRITSLGGKAISGGQELRPMLSEYDPGDVVEVVYIRDGQELKTSATLKARG